MARVDSTRGLFQDLSLSMVSASPQKYRVPHPLEKAPLLASGWLGI